MLSLNAFDFNHEGRTKPYNSTIHLPILTSITLTNCRYDDDVLGRGATSLLNPESLPALKSLIIIPSPFSASKDCVSWGPGIVLLAPQLESFAFAARKRWPRGLVLPELQWLNFKCLKRLFLQGSVKHLTVELKDLVDLITGPTSLETIYIVLEHWNYAESDYGSSVLKILKTALEQFTSSALRHMTVGNSSRGDFFTADDRALEAWQALQTVAEGRGVDFKFSRKFQSRDEPGWTVYQNPWAEYVQA